MIGLAVVLSFASPVRSEGLLDAGVAKPKSVRIPVAVAEVARTGLVSLNLFVSPDRGQTWKLVETITRSSKPAFRFTPAGQGTYWLACQTVGKGGRMVPESLDALGPAIAVTVNSDDVVVSKP